VLLSIAFTFGTQHAFAQAGSLDLTFAPSSPIGAGKVRTAIGAGTDTARSVVIQPDKKIVVAGDCVVGSRLFCVARYNADGSLDTSFDGDGSVVIAVGGGNNFGISVALRPDGKIEVVGKCWNGTNNDFCVVRYEGVRSCSLDIDGDGQVLAPTDSLINARVALGMTGAAVTNGITFPVAAKRNSWATIRPYLASQCGLSLPN